jgi:hypothetical protein
MTHRGSMLVAVFGKQGRGGAIMFGYRKIADVLTWRYTPNPGGTGEGTIEVDIANEHPAYADRSAVSVELQTKTGGMLRWADAERFGDTIIVAGPPTD